jgi:hypothetical protein
MPIYSTDTYEVLSVTMTVTKSDQVPIAASVFFQRLPTTQYPDITWYSVSNADFVASDFDTLDNFVANTIPKLETFISSMDSISEWSQTVAAPISETMYKISLSINT